MKQTLTIAFLILSFTSSYGQWMKIFGGVDNDEGYSVQQTSNGNFIVTGTTQSFGNWYQLWLLKVDVNGDTIWTKTYGGSDSEAGFSVQETNDGGYIVTGYGYNYSNPTGADMYLLKTDFNGDSVWAKTITNPNVMAQSEVGFCVQQTFDGGYIILAENSQEGCWLIKTDVNGDSIWTQTFDADILFSSIQQTTDSGYIVTGSYSGDLWLLKTDMAGDSMWIKTYGDPSGEHRGYSVIQTTDGGYAITGSTAASSQANSDVWLLKTDSNGDTTWTKTYSSMASIGYSLQQTMDNGYIITGVSGGVSNKDLWLIKTDSNGDTTWTRKYGGVDFDMGISLDQTTDGGYIITGSYCYSNSWNDCDLLLIKTNAQGDTVPILNTVNDFDKDFFIYPNPFSNYTNIKLPNFPGSLSIYDILGNLLYHDKFSGDYVLEKGKLNKGIYIISIESGNNIYSKKLIVN